METVMNRRETFKLMLGAAAFVGATGLGRNAAMAQAIVRLLKDDGLRKRMGEAGLARVSGRFTVDRMVVETSAAYARVAGRGHVAGIENPEVPAPHLRD